MILIANEDHDCVLYNREEAVDADLSIGQDTFVVLDQDLQDYLKGRQEKEEEQHNMMTVKDTSKLLNIPVPTIYYLIRKGKLGEGVVIRIGGRWRINCEKLKKYLEL